MSVTITYKDKDKPLETLNGGEYVILHTNGKTMEDDIRVEVAEVSGGDPVLQEKTVTENGEVTADDGYDGLSKVTVNVSSGIALTNVQPMFLVKDIVFIAPDITTANVSVALNDISGFTITKGE